MADTGIKRESKFYICTTPQTADLNQSEYEGLTWVAVGNVVTLPNFGITDNMVTQNYINTDVSQRQKGFRQASETEVVIGRDYEDTGQAAIRTAAATRFSYAMKLESSDAPDASTTNSIRYSRGVIGGPDFPGGGGEDFDNETFQIGLNQAPIIVDPVAIP